MIRFADLGGVEKSKYHTVAMSKQFAVAPGNKIIDVPIEYIKNRPDALLR
jgi:hypothetical protein